MPAAAAGPRPTRGPAPPINAAAASTADTERMSVRRPPASARCPAHPAAHPPPLPSDQASAAAPDAPRSTGILPRVPDRRHPPAPTAADAAAQPPASGDAHLRSTSTMTPDSESTATPAVTADCPLSAADSSFLPARPATAPSCPSESHAVAGTTTHESKAPESRA